MSDMKRLIEKMDQFAGQAVGQKPGDQVRGTEKATPKKSGKHPFAGRLVGASEGKSLLADLEKELVEGAVKRGLKEEFEAFKAQGVAEGSEENDYKISADLINRKTDMPVHKTSHVRAASEEEAVNKMASMWNKEYEIEDMYSLVFRSGSSPRLVDPRVYSNIIQQGVAEGAPELLKAEIPLVREIEKELAAHGYQKGTEEYEKVFDHMLSFHRKFGNADRINQPHIAEGMTPDNMFLDKASRVKQGDKVIYKGKVVGIATGETLDGQIAFNPTDDEYPRNKHGIAVLPVDNISLREDANPRIDLTPNYPNYSKLVGEFVGVKGQRVQFKIVDAELKPGQGETEKIVKAIATGKPILVDISRVKNRAVMERIVKHGDEYRLLSHKDKNLGDFDTKSGAEKHEREVQYFKHMGESKDMCNVCGQTPCNCTSLNESASSTKLNEYAPGNGDDDNNEDALRYLARDWFHTEDYRVKQRIQSVLIKLGYHIDYIDDSNDIGGVALTPVGKFGVDWQENDYIQYHEDDLNESRIMHSDQKVNLFYKPDERMSKAQIVAKLIPNSKVNKYIQHFVQKFGVKSRDFEAVPAGRDEYEHTEESLGGVYTPPGGEATATDSHSPSPIGSIEIDEDNQLDTVTMDIPFLIRVMEFSREDAKDDMILHSAVEKMIAASGNAQVLTMDNYEEIFGAEKPEEVSEQEEFGYKKLHPEIFKARQKYPAAKSDMEALLLAVRDEEHDDVNRLNKVNDREDAEIDALDHEEDYLQQQIRALKAQLGKLEKIATSRAPMEEDVPAPVATAGGPAGITQPKQTPPGTPVDPAAVAMQKQNQAKLQQNLANLKTAGVQIDPAKAAQTFQKTDTGAPMNAMDKDTIAKMAPAIGNVMSNPSTATQLNTLIKKAGGGA